MYENFVINGSDEFLQGYLWEGDTVDYVVCLVHGIGEYAGRYHRMGEIFKSANICLVSMDLRGHGLSSGPRGHVAPRKKVLEEIDLLIDYAAERFQQVPLILYGHSMGGNLVLDYRRRGRRAQVPVGYLVTSPWVLLVQKVPAYLYHGVKLLARLMPKYSIKTNVAIDGNKSVISQEKNKELFHGRISLQTAVESFETGEALMNGSLNNLHGEELKPLLLMHGDADKSCSPEGSSQIAALEEESCEYLEWPGYYHELHNGTKDKDGSEVIEAMIKWITGF